jgi:hypothetical protein
VEETLEKYSEEVETTTQTVFDEWKRGMEEIRLMPLSNVPVFRSFSMPSQLLSDHHNILFRKETLFSLKPIP